MLEPISAQLPNDISAPILATPKMLQEEPRRIHCLTESDDPTLANSKALVPEASRANDLKLQLLPITP